MAALAALLGGVALVVWGADLFADHVGPAAARLGVSAFALGLLLAGAEPEELATVLTASARDVPGIAFGDVVGANVALSLVALGAGALFAPLVLGARIGRYALGALPLAVLAVGLAWDGRVGRIEGALLVVLYGAYVTVIWRRERRVVGEAAEADTRRTATADAAARRTTTADTAARRTATADAGPPDESAARSRRPPHLLLAVAGIAALGAGSLLVVEAVERLTDVEETQTRLGLTLIGFATAFEMAVLVVAAVRRGRADAIEAAVAGVVGSFAYNVTMTLGAGALVRPLRLVDPAPLRLPLVWMPLSLGLALALALPGRRLTRPAGAVLLVAYAGFVVAVALS